MREIEVKVRAKDLEDVARRLAERGIQLSAPASQHDTVYAHGGSTAVWEEPSEGHTVARIRRENDRSLLTLKVQRSNEHDNVETETEVKDADAMHDILVSLGWTPGVEVKKIRRTGTLGEYRVCLDNVEELGSFVELEKLASDDADPAAVQEELLKEIESLGLSRRGQVARGYDTQMYRMARLKPATTYPEKAAETDHRFAHVMAIALDPQKDHREGVIRCVVSREGDVAAHGFVDRSELHHVWGDSLERFEIGDRLEIENETEVIEQLHPRTAWDFLGLEDPDIWRDDRDGKLHLYFTMPYLGRMGRGVRIYLGHAVGDDVRSLRMTEPALSPDANGDGAKELSVAPPNSKGVRLNLVESSKREGKHWYSVVRVAEARDMSAPWSFGEVVFHPAERGRAWAGGHASPGPLLPESFLDLGPGRRLGILNGREANREADDGTTQYGIFSVGLFIYDYEGGKIEWVSPEPLVRDTDARTITFASQFVPTKPGEGILYAHVDDSFVRAYALSAEAIEQLLPR